MSSYLRARSLTTVGMAAVATLLVGGLTALPARADSNQIKPDIPHSLAAAAEVATDQFIVGIKEKAGPAATAASEAASNAASKTGVPASRLRQTATGAQIVKTDRALAARDAEGFLAALRADPEVAYAEPDAIMQPASVDPNDGLYSLQWDLWEEQAGLRAPGAWTVSRGEGVVVAVVDTGILSHSELDANVLPGYDMMSSALEARDGDGRDADPTDEGDWVSAGQCTGGDPASISSWHGTHVAGTIAAVGNNGSGVTGVAPAAKILPLRALGPCGGYTSDIADSIVWAAGGVVTGAPVNANPARVINLSLGGITACSATYQNAINFAYNSGAAVVAAAGNSNRPAADSSPANCQNVITVAASGRSGARAPYSNYGSAVDVTAPGGDMTADIRNGILSTSNMGETSAAEEAYEFQQGTSMAAPHVAGVAALLSSELGQRSTPAIIENRLKTTTRRLGGGCLFYGCGSGLVDATAALNLQLDVPTTAGTPTIAGLASVGHTLKASPGTWSPQGVAFAYQWQRNGTDIAGATTANYILVAADLGAKVSVEVTGTRLFMDSVSAVSEPSAEVIVGTITGPVPQITESVGDRNMVTYTVNPGLWEPAPVTLSYQWKRSGGDIPEATGTSYARTLADIGHGISVRVTGTKAGYETEQRTSATTEVPPVTAIPLKIAVVPPPVTFTDHPGTELDSYNIPSMDGVEYLISGAVVAPGTYSGAGSVTVTARATANYVISSGAVAEWSHTFKATPYQVSPAAVVFTDKDGTAEDTYTIPGTEGVEYLVGGTVVAPGTHPGFGLVTVTARAKTDYLLAAGAAVEWSHTFKATPYPVSPAAVVFTDKDGTAEDTYTIPGTEGVEYLVGGTVVAPGMHPGAGLVTVTARAKTDYVLAAGAAAEWSHAFSAKFPAVPGSLIPVTPFRALDTRDSAAAVGPDKTVSFQVAGVNGIPAEVSAVVFNLTVAEAKDYGFVTAYASQTVRPDASNLNFNAGQIVANAVTVPVGADGKVTLYNRSDGATQLLADVSAYYLRGTPTAAGAFAPLAPSRFLDTRTGPAVGADSSTSFQVAGRNGVPAGVSAVVFNLTVAEAKDYGFITAYASNTVKPDASNVNFNAGQIIPNAVTVPVGADGKVTLFNRSSGATHLLADVSGYYLPGTPTAAGTFQAVAPKRFLDTRDTASAAGKDATISFAVGGAHGIPVGASAVVFNLTVAEAKSYGFITAFASGTTRPTVSNLNFNAGQIVPNSVTVPVGTDGRVNLYNRSDDATHLVADVSGYFLPG